MSAPILTRSRKRAEEDVTGRNSIIQVLMSLSVGHAIKVKSLGEGHNLSILLQAGSWRVIRNTACVDTDGSGSARQASLCARLMCASGVVHQTIRVKPLQ